MYAKGQKPDKDKLYATIYSHFGEPARMYAGNMRTTTTLYLNWLNRILVREKT